MMARPPIHSAAVRLIAALLVFLAAATWGQQTEIKKTPVPYTAPSSGKGMYLAYCASCHGQNGKGDGPAAPSMKYLPADLTQLAAKNGGKFPENRVSQTIQGDAPASSHGSKDMPVWGPIFRAMGTTSDGVAQLRVRNLTKYIASLQQR